MGLGAKIAGFIPGFSWVRVIMISIVALALWGAWSHYTSIRDQRDQLIADLATEKTAHAVTKAEFADYEKRAREQVETIKKSLSSLEKEYAKARRQSDELREKLAKHDFGYLAYQKPGLVGGVVNRGTRGVLDAIRKSTRDFGSSGSGEPSGKVPETTTPANP